MPTLVFNGPAVPSDVHNVVLRDVLFAAPSDRASSPHNYHLVEVGIREDVYTTWIGSWDQSQQRVEGAVPFSMLDMGRLGMRLREKQVMVVRVTVTGCPASLDGCRVIFRMGRVGGRDGPATPLVAAGSMVADSNSRVALRALERQINTGGLSDWEDGLELYDPVNLVTVGTFQGRLQVDSTTTISLQRYDGNWVEVDGEAVSLGSSGYGLTTSTGLLAATGYLTATAPSASTLYYVYLGYGQLRLSATAPSKQKGIYYLGSNPAGMKWRFCGWAYTNSSTQFTDGITARHVINYYNRIHKRLFLCPNYADGNTETTYTMNSSTWVKVTGDANSDVSFVTNGEDIVHLSVTLEGKISSNGNFGPGIGIDGITDVRMSGDVTTTTNTVVHVTMPYAYQAGTTAGRHTASIVARNSAGTLTIYADDERHGASADPACTYLDGWILT